MSAQPSVTRRKCQIPSPARSSDARARALGIASQTGERRTWSHIPALTHHSLLSGDQNQKNQRIFPLAEKGGNIPKKRCRFFLSGTKKSATLVGDQRREHRLHTSCHHYHNFRHTAGSFCQLHSAAPLILRSFFCDFIVISLPAPPRPPAASSSPLPFSSLLRSFGLCFLFVSPPPIRCGLISSVPGCSRHPSRLFGPSAPFSTSISSHIITLKLESTSAAQERASTHGSYRPPLAFQRIPWGPGPSVDPRCLPLIPLLTLCGVLHEVSTGVPNAQFMRLLADILTWFLRWIPCMASLCESLHGLPVRPEAGLKRRASRKSHKGKL